MDPPSTVTMDADACIKHSLYLGTIHDYYCRPIRCFVNGCLNKSISIGTFKTAKDHSYRNVVKAVNDLAKERGMGKQHYAVYKMCNIATANLDKLFARLIIFQETWADPEVEKAREFFISNQKPIAPHSAPDKNPIPERHDLVFFVCVHNLELGIVHIVSNDSHFTAYAEEIANSEYGIRVIPVQDLDQLMIGWKWPISS